MVKIVIFTLLVFRFFAPAFVYAADQNVVTPAFPIRGQSFWRGEKDIQHLTQIISGVKKNNLYATWFIQYDALFDPEIVSDLLALDDSQQKGLFLEATRNLAEENKIVYQWETDDWTVANKIFLSGYLPAEREQMIDSAMEKFKDVFGDYPKTVGAWHIDSYSLSYLKEKYNIKIVLGLADQYSTDGYQVWGQYINQPYFISEYSSIEPAIDKNNTGILKLLWAPREPTLSYGRSVEYSNFSAQANDYNRSKDLDHKYFQDFISNNLLAIEAPLSQLVIGIEISELPFEKLNEVFNQLNYLGELQKQGKIKTQTFAEFSSTYGDVYQGTNPSYFVSSEPITGLSSYWYFSPNYRIGIMKKESMMTLVDLRFYHQSKYFDNDYSDADKHQNLQRIVPAIVDNISLGNAVELSSGAGSVETEKDGDKVIMKFNQREIILKPKDISFIGFSIEDLGPLGNYVENKDKIFTISPEANFQESNFYLCHNREGGYVPPFPCLKKIITSLIAKIPNLNYSKIEGQLFFGIPKDKEHLFGVRFPKVKIGLHSFDYFTLANFISLKSKITPSYSWYARQEDQVEKYKSEGKLIEKNSGYGQNNLENNFNKIFENGYYAILSE